MQARKANKGSSRSCALLTERKRLEIVPQHQENTTASFCMLRRAPELLASFCVAIPSASKQIKGRNVAHQVEIIQTV